MLEAAPVGDNSGGGAGAGNGYQVSGGNGRVASFGPGKSEMSRPLFTGTGNTLGSSNNSSSNNTSSKIGMSIPNILGNRNSSANKGVDELTDRREKARKAALARLERNGSN